MTESPAAELAGSLAAFKEIAGDPERFRFAGDPALAPDWFDADLYLWYDGGPGKLPFLYGEQRERVHRWWIDRFGPARIEHWRTETVRPLVAARPPAAAPVPGGPGTGCP